MVVIMFVYFDKTKIPAWKPSCPLEISKWAINSKKIKHNPRKGISVDKLVPVPIYLLEGKVRTNQMVISYF